MPNKKAVRPAASGRPEARWPSKCWAAAGCLTFLLVFVRVYVIGWDIDWDLKFSVLNVPTLPTRGADARNIQMTAHCTRLGHGLYGFNPCMQEARIVKQHQANAHVPAFNYPSIWPIVYGLFEDDSEAFFRAFWMLNAMLLATCLLLLAWRFNPWIFPLLLFSPITLLAVERGNIDASTFAVTFIPALVAPWPLVALGLVAAGALKVFPAFGLAAMLRACPSWARRRAMWGAAAGLPLLVHSIAELPQMVGATHYGFEASYGLMSFFKLHLLIDRQGAASVVAAGLAVLVLLLAWLLVKSHGRMGPVVHWVRQIDERERTLLLVSLFIFLSTFFLFNNWAYRLIFLTPAAAVLAAAPPRPCKAASAVLIGLLWLPILPFGWQVLSFACLPVASLACALAWVGWQGCGRSALR